MPFNLTQLHLMKKSFTPGLLLFTLALFPLLLSAQDKEFHPKFYVGPSVGYQQLTFSTDYAGQGETTNSATTGPTLGMGMLSEMGTRAGLHLQAGLQKSKFTTSRTVSEPEIGTGRRQFNYVDKAMTLEALYRYSLTPTHLGPFLEGGFRGGIPVKSRVMQYLQIDKDPSLERRDEMTGFDYGAAVALGYRLGALEARLQAGFAARAGYEYAFSSRQVAVQVAYRFPMLPLH